MLLAECQLILGSLLPQASGQCRIAEPDERDSGHDLVTTSACNIVTFARCVRIRSRRTTAHGCVADVSRWREVGFLPLARGSGLGRAAQPDDIATRKWWARIFFRFVISLIARRALVLARLEH